MNIHGMEQGYNSQEAVAEPDKVGLSADCELSSSHFGGRMRFNINKTELQNALSVVLKGVSTRSTLPVLSGVFVSVDADRMVLQSTDLDLSIKYSAPALVEEPGCTVVPGKLFSDIVKNMPDASIRISYEEGAADAQIACDKSAISVKTLSAEDFPGFPTVSANQTLTLPFDMFSKMVKRVSKVVSKDDSRAILTGVLVETEGPVLRMVATDSYRLAMTEMQVEGAGVGEVEDFSAVIGGAFLNDVAGMNATGEKVTIGVADNQIVVSCGDTTFINRRIEGQYPNYRQLLPDGYTTRATLPVEALTSAVKRASLMSSSTSPVKFNLAPAPVNLASITVNSADVGSIRESIDCQIEGEEIEIAFNSSYVAEGLMMLRDEEVHFDVQSSLKPGIFHSIDSKEYLYLIMPVRI